jgi:hypothetical protein
MRFSPQSPLALTAALALVVAPVGSAASASLPTNTACSNGPSTASGGRMGAVPGCTTRVSMSYQNTDPDNTSQRPRISEDGNYVVFQSGADHLVQDWSAGHGSDDYWVDRRDPAGTIEMVDRAADRGMPNSVESRGATFVDLSGDGRYVVFYSTATNLVAGKKTRSGSIYLRDMVLDKTIEVPRSFTGGDTNNYSNRPTISGYPDGVGDYYVTYNAKGTNLVRGNTHPNDIYVSRFNPGTFTVGLPALVSKTAGGAASNGGNEHAEISSDGNYIAWQSDARNLDGRANGKTQIYESANPLTVASAHAVLVSVSSSGAVGNQSSTRPAIDGSGDEVAWESVSNNLAPDDTNGVLDAFLRGTRAGAFIGVDKTIRVSVDSDGRQLAGASQRPNLDGAGDTVGFAANAHTVVRGDTNGQRDVFLRDLRTGTNTLIDVCRTGGFPDPSAPCAQAAVPARSGTSGPAAPYARPGGEDLSSRTFLSADGLKVAFISGLDDLVPNDNNGAVALDDIFVRDFTGSGPTATGFPIPAGPPAAAATTTGPTYVFSRGPDGAVHYETNAGSGWSSAASLNGSIQAAPGAAAGGNGSAEVFVRGTDDQLYSRLLVGGTWTPWASAGGELSSSPAAAAWAAGRDDVFVRGSGTDQALYHRALVNGVWGPWQALDGHLLGSPGASSWAPGQLSVFVQGTDNQLWGRFYSSAGWSGWTSYGGVLASGPAAVSVPGGQQPGHVNVFVTGGDGGLYQQTIIDGRRGTWVPLGGVLAGGPAASSTGPGHYRVVGASPNGHLYERVYNGGWGPWTSLP